MATNEVIDNSLRINEAVDIDNSVEYYQYHEYTPQSQENLNSLGSTIKMTINATDDYVNTSKSYIVIKGKLIRSDNNNPYAANAEVSLINNAMMYLFSEIRYEIGGIIMERISDPGQTTSMLAYLSQPDDYSTSSGLKSCWSKDTTNNANSRKYNPSQTITQTNMANAIAAGYFTPVENPEYNQGLASRKGLLMSSNPRGCFSFAIPFEHIFGFGEYTKVMYGQKHSLSLTRMTSDNLAIHRANGVQDGKISLNYIAWKVPIIKPSIHALSMLSDIIIKKEYLPVAYSARNSESKEVTQTRTFDWTLNVTAGIEKPRWIIVGFQTDKNQTQEQNPAVFDHVNLSRAHVILGSDKYPTSDIITNFVTNDYSELYEMFDNF
jgi:hypothetical protein